MNRDPGVFSIGPVIAALPHLVQTGDPKRLNKSEDLLARSLQAVYTGRLLIADEDRRHESTPREYSFSGRYTGRSLPQDSFGAEAGRGAVELCGQRGYWIAVDQLSPLTMFHLFDRVTLAPREARSTCATWCARSD